VLDGSKDDRFDLTTHNDFGFDMTQFLAIEEARTPILAYLFHKINTTVAGSPHSIDIDEASNALKDPYLLNMIDDKARTVRKLDGIIGLSFQNAADACSGAIAATLANQFPTRIIFPNSSASRDDYIGGLKLTEKEYQLVRNGMNDKPGSFLIKKGHESVVVSADLSGMNNILSVLSGSEDNCIVARQIIKEVGSDPAIWLPEFFKRRN
jgi:type IV secretion system protein VirB4